ncbi:MAG: hypothetical protein HQL73_08335 [Magnetococcales bacterium]|nr:hypothetical protein [Magnetococcales bacterium]
MKKLAVVFAVALAGTIFSGDVFAAKTASYIKVACKKEAKGQNLKKKQAKIFIAECIDRAIKR